MRKIPSLRRHRPTSQAVVTLSGKDHYLGIWPAARKTAPPAIQLAYDLEELPAAERLLVIAEPWRPYRTLACRYLWRSLSNEPT